jgi:hypothetical protein
MRKIEMNKKWTPHAITAGVLAVFIVLGLACASAPKTAPVISADAGALTGKTTVIIPLTQAERKQPERSDTTMTGLLGVAQDKGVVSAWTKAFDSVVSRNEAGIAEKTKAAYEAFIEAYKTEYNATLVEAAFDFGKNAPTVIFFEKPDKKTASAIAQLCNTNNADYAITLLYRISAGPVVGTIASQDTVALSAVIVVFDKTGQVIAVREGQTPSATFRFNYAKESTTEAEFNAGLDQSLLNLYDNLKQIATGFAKGITTP